MLLFLLGLLDYEITLKIGIYSKLDRKSKTWFFTFLIVYVSWIERDKIPISQLSPPKFRYFSDQNGTKGGDHLKMNFGNFHIEKWIPQTFRAQKIDEKKWDHLSSFFFCFLSYGP